MFTSNNPPNRVLVWDDAVLDLQDAAVNIDAPLYIVGGAVRDAFMRRPMKDIDMATPASGIAVGRKLANVLEGDFYPLDPERGVGRVLIRTTDGIRTIDVATFRGTDLEADLRDRDFTINAMAVDLRGDLNALIDPLGGERDLVNKRLRRCAPNALTNDPIRAMRAVRQSVAFGFSIERETLTDIKNVAPRIAESSQERQRDELFHILAVAKPDSAMRIADTLGVLGAVLPETVDLHDQPGNASLKDGFAVAISTVEMLNQIMMAISPKRSDHTAAKFTLGTFVMVTDRYRKALQDHLDIPYPNERTHQTLLILSALLVRLDVKTVENRARALRLSNGERDRLILLARHRNWFMKAVDSHLTPLAIYRYWREVGSAGLDLILMGVAGYIAESNVELDQDAWIRVVDQAGVLFNAYFEHYDEWIDPPALVDGRQLMAALNVEPGRLVGELLERIREGQVEGRIQTKEHALAYARQLVKDNR